MYWVLIAVNLVIPQLLWSSKIRRNPLWLWMLSFSVQTGMWLERYMIIVTSLHRDFIPSSWGMFYPTRWDWMIFIGSIGLFFTLVLPVCSFLAHDLDFRNAGTGPQDGGGGHALKLEARVLRRTAFGRAAGGFH